MSMHMLPPMYSTTGKKKSKRQHRNADVARQKRAQAESWQELLKKWDIKPDAQVKAKSKPIAKSYLHNSLIPDSRRTSHIPSLDSGAGIASKKESQQYTGTECIGIAVMHKSCLQPVFSKQSAEDAAKMRRG